MNRLKHLALCTWPLTILIIAFLILTNIDLENAKAKRIESTNYYYLHDAGTLGNGAVKSNLYTVTINGTTYYATSTHGGSVAIGPKVEPERE